MSLFRLAIVQSYDNQEMITTIGLNMPNATAQKQIDFTEDIRQRWASEITPWQVNTWSATEVRWYDLTLPQGTPPTVQPFAGGPIVGASVEQGLPGQVAVLCSHTTVDGPPFRGRNYLAGVAENANQGSGKLAANAAADIQAFWDGLRSDALNLSADSDYLAVVRDLGVRPVTIHGRIVSTVVKDDFATQRRRSVYA